MVHAANIASLSKLAKYKAAFPGHVEVVEVQLQYPSASQREKYVQSHSATRKELMTPDTNLLCPYKMTTLRH